MKNNYICYCFKHTREALEEDVRKHGRSTIMEKIIAASKDGSCTCVSSNPAGT